MEKELIGHSGCKIYLIKIDDRLMVEKKANEHSYNERLEKQCWKQCNVHKNNFIPTRVVESGYDKENLFYFRMEYISGKTLAEYMRDIELSEIKKIVYSIDVGIAKKYDPNAKYIFIKKLNDIKEKLDSNNPIINSVFDMLISYDWSMIEKSDCHGDFTLENIIVSKEKKLYLIDYLDSFYDSWMVDLAKILQDIELFWHYRYEKCIESNLRLRLLIFRELLVNRIRSLPNGNNLLDSIYHILALNILRIFPYTKDELTYRYLIEQLLYLVENYLS